MCRRKAEVAGVAVGAGVGGGLIGATAALSGPVANLGGYAIAQMIAGAAGLGGPALSASIAAVGGPVVAGLAVAGGLGYGAYRLSLKILGPA